MARKAGIPFIATFEVSSLLGKDIEIVNEFNCKRRMTGLPSPHVKSMLCCIMDTDELRVQIDELKRRRDDPTTSESDREEIEDAIASLALTYQVVKAIADD